MPQRHRLTPAELKEQEKRNVDAFLSKGGHGATKKKPTPKKPPPQRGVTVTTDALTRLKDAMSGKKQNPKRK